MNEVVLSGLRDAVARAKADPEVRVVVLTGAGDKAFCAGADLKSSVVGGGALETHHGRSLLADVFLEMTELGKPTIARVNGHALAGGFGLALACDIVIASRSATLGSPSPPVDAHHHHAGGGFRRGPPRLRREARPRLEGEMTGAWGGAQHLSEASTKAPPLSGHRHDGAAPYRAGPQ